MVVYHVKKRFVKSDPSLTAGSSIQNRRFLTAELRNRRRRAVAIEAQLDVARQVVLARDRARLAGNAERGRRVAARLRVGVDELNLAERTVGRNNRLAHVLQETSARRVDRREGEAGAIVSPRRRGEVASRASDTAARAAVRVHLVKEGRERNEVRRRINLLSTSLSG